MDEATRVAIGGTVGHIRIVDSLGAGGMGEVFVGFDETLRRRVALKAIAGHHRLSSGARARFLREARMLSRLDHPNICRIYDFLEVDGTELLVLELIGGRSLGEAIAHGLAPRRRLEIARDVASALAAAHGEGIVHRDLKPGNVMLTEAGEVKVLDFGLARSEGSEAAAPGPPAGPTPDRAAPGDQASAATLDGGALEATRSAPAVLTPRAAEPGVAAPSLRTAAGSIVGTPHFMSPEQARGEAVTTASDMYSFGLLLQTLATGTPPYPVDLPVAEVVERAARAAIEPPSGLDRDLARLVERLCSAAPAARPTAATALERIGWLLDKPRRRLRRLAAAALVSVAVLGGVKYTVDLDRERDAAVAALQVADQRRGQAESLIGFMLGDLREKLEPVGRLEILDDVGQQAMEYFAAVPEHELSDEELLGRSRALYQIGDVRMAEGDLAGARQPLVESLALARSLRQRDPDDPERLFGLGQSLFWVGYVEYQLGALDPALAAFEEYFSTGKRLAALDPDNSEWQLEVAYGHNNLAMVLERQGRFGAALEQYRESAAVRERLAAMEPSNDGFRAAWAHSVSLLGRALQAEGRWDEAVAHLARALEIRRRLHEGDRQHADRRWKLAVSHNNLGALLLARGDSGGAVEAFGADLELTRGLVELDPANARWSRSLGVTLRWLGIAHLERGLPDAALEFLGEAVAHLERLVAADPEEVEGREHLAEAHTAAARALLERGDPRAALERVQAARTVLAPLVDGREPTPAQRQRLARAALVHCQALATLGRRREAHAAAAGALAVLEPVESARARPELMELRVRALLLLDRADEARPLVGRLTALGFRGSELERLGRDRGLGDLFDTDRPPPLRPASGAAGLQAPGTGTGR